jgi:branched-chain amino acid transport system permease protein
MKTMPRKALVLAPIVAVLALLPLVLSDARVSELARVGIFFIALTGLSLVTGTGGQVSLGHGAFMAVGAYTTALLVAGRSDLRLAGLDPSRWLPVGDGIRDVYTVPIAALVAALVGVVVGLPARRLRGLSLAIVTFAFAVALPQVLREAEGTTGGVSGIDLATTDRLTGSPWLYYLTWTLALAGLGVAWRLLRRGSGSLGFAISAAFAGVAGSLLAIVATSTSPGTFGLLLSLQLVAGVVIAGTGSLWGLAVAALLLQYVPIWLDSPGLPSLTYGVAVLVVLLLFPRGAAEVMRRLAGFAPTRGT